MRRLTQYQIDAFAHAPFTGNPAAVIYMDAPLPAALMQAIAAENNLSETAFLTPIDLTAPNASVAHYNIRWFTPTSEIEFCGHATLAAAHALNAHILKESDITPEAYIFHGQLDPLRVDVVDQAAASVPSYQLSAPALKALPQNVTPAMQAAFSMALSGAFMAGPNLYVIAQRWQDVAQFQPDRTTILPLSAHGVGLTAQGGPIRDNDTKQADCTSRFFVPALGIDEDPVTGSAHTALAPYWSEALGKDELLAFQASRRGGWLKARICGDQVSLSGPALTFAIMEIFVPD